MGANTGWVNGKNLFGRKSQSCIFVLHFIAVTIASLVGDGFVFVATLMGETGEMWQLHVAVRRFKAQREFRQFNKTQLQAHTCIYTHTQTHVNAELPHATCSVQPGATFKFVETFMWLLLLLYVIVFAVVILPLSFSFLKEQRHEQGVSHRKRSWPYNARLIFPWKTKLFNKGN